MSMKEFGAEDGTALVEPDDAWPMPPATVEAAPTEQFAMLELALVVPSRTNPRTTFNPAKLSELAESIRATGVHQPVLVRPLPISRLTDEFERLPREGGQLPTHEIVSGERRYRASSAAGRTTIPAMIRTLTDSEVLEIQIIENLQRDDLTELEEAEGYQRLCETTGITKDAVGERIGKSRSYVYGRMKLLDLAPNAREALRSGDIDGSKALLIARIPDEKQQMKALTQATEKDHQGSPRLSYRALKSWVEMNVMLKLAAARFDIVDASLVPAAGSCPDCPKRTHANPDLFADVDGPDLCIDAPCFHAKEAAHTERLVADAKAKGMEVLEGKEAKECMPYPNFLINGLTRMTSEIREALSERELKGKIKLLIDPHGGEAIEVVGNDVAMKARGKGIDKKMDKAAAKRHEMEAKQASLQEKRNLERDYEQRWRAAAIAVIHPRIVAGEIRAFSANLLRRVLFEIAMCDNRCEDEVPTVLDVPPFDDDLLASSIRALDDNEVGIVVLLVLLHGDASPVYDHQSDERCFDPSAPVIEELATLLDVSLADIKAKVQAEIRAELEPKAPAANELAAPQEGSAKGAKNSKRPAAPARKTTKEEAAQGIAAALQALAAEPEGGQEALAAPVLKAAAEETPAAAALEVGHLARVRAGTKGPTGKGRKTAGKVGRICSIDDTGRAMLRHGPRSHEYLMLPIEDLERYFATPLVGDKVRVIFSNDNPSERLDLQWREGTVAELRSDGWRVDFPGQMGAEPFCEVFETTELEVLA